MQKCNMWNLSFHVWKSKFSSVNSEKPKLASHFHIRNLHFHMWIILDQFFEYYYISGGEADGVIFVPKPNRTVCKVLWQLKDCKSLTCNTKCYNWLWIRCHHLVFLLGCVVYTDCAEIPVHHASNGGLLRSRALVLKFSKESVFSWKVNLDLWNSACWTLESVFCTERVLWISSLTLRWH